MSSPHKVLIIKTGYSEILEMGGNSRRVSLGDVLRTTPILHLYKEDRVTWLTDTEALPLLEQNKYISRLMSYDFTTRDQLTAERFDILINLEKFNPLCGLAKQINAWAKYGFRLDEETGNAKAFDRAFEVLTVSADPILKKENKVTTQELLFKMLGAKWEGEEYILGYRPKNEETYDVALNTRVGTKWPTKAWSRGNWDELENLLKKDGLKVTRQDTQEKEILTNLYSYIDWINSSHLMVSNDSLGLHLGLALKKKVLGLFGSTPDREVYFYGLGESLTPSPAPECLPCFSPKCHMETNCIDIIRPERVYNKIMEKLK